MPLTSEQLVDFVNASTRDALHCLIRERRWRYRCFVERSADGMIAVVLDYRSLSRDVWTSSVVLPAWAKSPPNAVSLILAVRAAVYLALKSFVHARLYSDDRPLVVHLDFDPVPDEETK